MSVNKRYNDEKEVMGLPAMTKFPAKNSRDWSAQSGSRKRRETGKSFSEPFHRGNIAFRSLNMFEILGLYPFKKEFQLTTIECCACIFNSW